MARAIGIDLGAAWSRMAVFQNGAPVVIPSLEGELRTPSVVAFLSDGTAVVGEAARRVAISNPDRTVRSFKRGIGTRKTFDIDGHTYTPHEIGAQMLRKLKHDAEAYLDDAVSQAVITVPAYFDDAQRTGTTEAARLAGLEVLRIISDPVATGLAVWPSLPMDDETVLIADLGASSLSLALMEIGEGVYEVKSTNGDTSLGGHDWDQRIVDWLVARFKDDYDVDLATHQIAVQRLWEVAEKAKIELSDIHQTQISLPYIVDDDGKLLDLDETLSREKFNELTADLVETCKGPFNQAIKDAGLKTSDINRVILVGGSARTPVIQELVQNLTGMKPYRGVNPEELVALGAAIQAGVLKGEIKDILVMDVAPLSLGIETRGGIATKLIERNTTIPTRRTEVFTTAEDMQPSVEIHVLQGEREMASYNKTLGKFQLVGLPPALRGIPQIEVTFDIDANGIVHVSAKDRTTGKEQSMTVTGRLLAWDDEHQPGETDALVNLADQVPQERPPELSQRAIDALALLDRDRCRDYLAALSEIAPERAVALRAELPVGDGHTPTIAGNLPVLVWRVLDRRSGSVFEPIEQPVARPERASTSGDPSASETAVGEPETPDRRRTPPTEHTMPAQKGRTLEDGLRALLGALFDLQQASSWKLRQQTSGTQFGFDVAFSAPDALGRCSCFFECKNYASAISLAEVSPKVLQVEAHWAESTVDHWILVSPKTDAVNELDKLISGWNDRRRFPFTVQVWSPANGVRDFFRLDPLVYEAIYGEPCDELPADRRAQILQDFRNRLTPPLRVPPPFSRYISDRRPVRLPPDDPSWPSLLGRHIRRSALTGSGGAVSTPLLDTMVQWCDENRGRSAAALLLADFGEGKSFFTYELCDHLLAAYADRPTDAVLPLRCTLRDFRSAPSPKEFLDLQLSYYGADLSDFGELRASTSVVLLLDGIDEMSVRQDGRALTENLRQLQELLALVEGIPVVLASRPYFFESTSLQTRFFDRLRNPAVYRLGQPSRTERLSHLHAYADAIGASEKLSRIKALYDPIGLSAKVLFLEMLKETLTDLPDDDFSESVLYDTYIEKALRRKAELIDDVDASMSRDDLVESLKSLLEEVAVRIHQSGEGTVDLRTFGAGGPGLAAILWKLAQPNYDVATYDAESDAAARVGMRSLLKRVGTDDENAEAWKVEFSHRSLKEFFVGRAVLTALRSETRITDAQRLLGELHLEPVILHFLSQFRPRHADAQLARLETLARSASLGSGRGSLGGNALSCLVAMGGTTSDKDWSGLDLDTSILQGADLRGSSLQGSTLRWSVVDNTDLTSADLRDADFTGVQFQETSGVVALAGGESPNEVVVLYDDRSVRRWRIDVGGRTTCDTVVDTLATDYSALFYSEGHIVFLGSEGASIWAAPTDGTWSELARFPSDSRVRRVAVRGLTAAVVAENEVGRLSVSAVALESAETLWTQPCRSGVVGLSSRHVCSVHLDGSIALYDISTGELVAKQHAGEDITALAVRDEGGRIGVGIVSAGGDIRVIDVGPDGFSQVRASGSEIVQAVSASATWLDSGLAVGGGSRKVVIFRQVDASLVEHSSLKREVRCSGALVGGLIGLVERAQLVAHGAVE